MAGKETVMLPDGATAGASARYRNAIAKARQEVPTVAPLANVPHFDRLPKEEQPDPSRPPPLKQVSTKTAEGLAKIANAQAAPAKAPVVAPAATSEAAVPEAPVEEDENVKLRKTIEARLKPFDIGQYLVSGGTLTQLVPIIPDKLFIEFRTVTDYEEVYVELKIAEDASLKSVRSVERRQMEWAAAAHIHSLNGTVWPSPLNVDGSVNDEAMKDRFERVRKQPSLILNMIIQNCGWFLDRVQAGLNVEALKNG